MHPESDAALVFRCLDGDTEAYAALVRRYQGAVYATAHYYMGRYGEADDVAQEAFWQAYKSLPHLRDPEKFGPWLKEVSTRTAANWLRRNLPRLRMETPLPAKRTVRFEDVRRGPQGIAERGEIYDRVQMAIDALPERYRLIVVLRFMQEMSYDEIGRFTGESRDEIRGVLHRATVQLREMLEEQDERQERVPQWLRNRK
jgi:RNA polymerase sigma-70 factor (ECF subfamily)